MEYLSYNEYSRRADGFVAPYWRDAKVVRWQYISVAIAMLSEIDPETACEAGTNGMPICNSSVVLSYPEYDLNILDTYQFGGRFNAFVALQVWEHLTAPARAFRAVMALADHAILSFPYKWRAGAHDHRDIDDDAIASWTCGVAPLRAEVVGMVGKVRKVGLWRFR